MSEKRKQGISFKKLLSNPTFQRACIGVAVLIISYVVVLNGAEPKKYQLNEGDKSEYTIYAPGEVEDTITTRKLQEEAAKQVTPKYSRDESITQEALDSIPTLIANVLRLNSQGASDNKSSIEEKEANLGLSKNQVDYLLDIEEYELMKFQEKLKEIVKKVMDQGITEESLERNIVFAEEEIEKTELPNVLKGIGKVVCYNVIKPNMIEDKALTERARQEAWNRSIAKYERGQIIISKGETVTDAQIEVLKKLNLIKVKGKVDFLFYLSIFGLMALLGIIFAAYLYYFNKEILESRSDLILIGVIFILTLLMARGFSEISVYLIPFSFAPILISLLLDVRLAVFTNIILAVLITVITKGNINFAYLSIIGGTFAAFAVSKADQRRKLVLAGLALSLVNGLVILCIGVIGKELSDKILIGSVIGIVNGLFSIVLAIGTLPFWESTFNVITPLKLLELSNPNQPLIKRLLLEAPGTYHHSLLVGNLAEVATEAIGGNELLARVAAFYHDIGKLKRPYFFKENQYLDNPHERMTPSLSALVITSHTRDGVELAEQYGIPMPIKDIIMQHHGTTLVAYFFHKAKKSERLENQTKQESFRYEGPRPTTREAAVVLLADSIEAAVRSMPDKTEGRIEGLVRKIIKDKLEDGQLDHCDLTLKDLDLIASAFMKVLSGCFHNREEYPELSPGDLDKEEVEFIDPLDLITMEEYKNDR